MTRMHIKNWLTMLGLLAFIAVAIPRAHGALPSAVRFGVAVETGDLRAASAWLDEGLDPNFLADRIGTGLMIAAWEGNIPMMALFVGRGAAIDAMNHHREQALMHAAWKGRLQAVQWLLEHGATLNRSGREWSALHYAAFNGHEDVARLLIERGADLDALSTNGSTPLMMAAREGHITLARMLVERGANTRIVNDWGDDALVWSMRYGHTRIAQVVSSPEEFAAAARKPRESFGIAVRSAPAPSSLDVLIGEMRTAQTRGNIPVDLQQAYLEAVKALRAQPAGDAALTDAVPQALEIRARQAAPEQEKALLLYEGGPPQEAFGPRERGASLPLEP